VTLEVTLGVPPDGTFDQFPELLSTMDFVAFCKGTCSGQGFLEAMSQRCLVLPTTGSARDLLPSLLTDPESSGRHRNPHITTSCILLDDSLTKVALLLHRKRQQWFYPGGHADGDWNWLGGAARECREELGPKRLYFGFEDGDVWPKEPGKRRVVLPRLVVRHDAGDHEHVDVVYALRTPDEQLSVAPEEGDAWRWFAMGEILNRSHGEACLTEVTRLVLVTMAQGCEGLTWAPLPDGPV
jgi:8-oxo-dGTP pyrophosphatase MutT (NUDIX family)